jgi:acyl transferase domain-containing protein
MSARSDTALEAATDNLAAHLEQRPEATLADVAYTCHVGRKAFGRRRVMVAAADDVVGAASALSHRDPRRVRSRVSQAGHRPVFFLFPGQGAQAAYMASEIYRAEPRFRDEVDRCSEVLRPLLGLDLRTLIYPEPERSAEAAEALRRTSYTQPALFTIEYALARQWNEWGVTPSAMLGHSIGEWVAACLAEVVPIDEALELVALRGRLMEEMAPGAMLAVALPESAAAEWIQAGLAMAAVNAPTACVLSGPPDLVEEVESELTGQGVQSQRLATSNAFHSAMMDGAAAGFVDHLAQRVTLRPPRIPFISNVSGMWIDPADAIDPVYWGRQLRETVRFADGVRELCQVPDAVLLEVGPGQTLARLARQHPAREARQPILSTIDSAPTDDHSLASMVGALGDLWLHGVEVDWQAFHAAEQCRRVPLPAYPFERQRYWIDGPATADYDDEVAGLHDAEPADAYAEAADAESAMDGWFYFPSWRPARPRSPADLEEVRSSRWLLLGDDVPIAHDVLRELIDAGQEVVRVRRGDAYARIGEREYEIRPDQPADYEALLDAVRDQSGVPDAVAHLWMTSAEGAGDDVSSTFFARHQDAGLHSLTALVQALDSRRVTEPLRINVVGAGIYPVIGTEQLCPAKATVIGPCLVVPQEYPNLSCRLIDVELPAPGATTHELARALTTELIGDSDDVIVAHRNGRRWVQTFDATYLDQPEIDLARTRVGGVYLITGGLGRIGTVLSGFLARTVPDVKLVLTGRSPLPPRRQWESCLDGAADVPTAARIRAMRELQASGAEVAYYGADASNPTEMSRVIEEVEGRFGPLAGVIHAAGDTEAYFPVAELDREAVERQFKPKVQGLMVLDELLRGRDLDFCVLLSSLAAQVGGAGLAGYAAANCFMDALAAQRNQRSGTPWVSVNWGAWHFPRAKDIEGADDQDREGVSTGATVILPDEGEMAFGAILARVPRQVIVSPRWLPELYEEAVLGPSAAAPAPSDGGAPPSLHGRPDLAAEYVAPRSTTETEIAEMWEQLLGVAPIGIDDDFFELGGHSLLAIQLVSRLRAGLAADAVVSWVFDHPTIAALAESIETRDAVDQEAARALLDLVEGLSESEVKALLAEADRYPVVDRDTDSPMAGDARGQGAWPAP